MPKKWFLSPFVFLMLVIAGVLLSVSVAGAGKVAPEVVYAPTAKPDRIILTWSADPATTQSVTWRTDQSVRTGLAEIVPAGDGPDFAKGAQRVEAESDNFESSLGKARYHSVTFTGLKPGALYAYRVGDGDNWSEWNHFETLRAEAAPLSFLYLGDAQNNILEHWSRVIRTAWRHAPEAQFVVYGGDLVNRGDHDDEWGEWFEAAGWVHRVIPALPSPGNHEHVSPPTGERYLASNWQMLFTLPDNGPSGYKEVCYYIDLQGVRLISLNSMSGHELQAGWLEKALAKNPNRWTILVFHHPLYSSGKGRDNKELRALLQPLIDRHGVDLVLQGHDHTYARTGLVSGSGRHGAKHGTVYLNSGSGPKMYKLDRKPEMVRIAEQTQLFQVVRIDGGRLTMEARTVTGELYDAFELRQRPGQPNELIDKMPATPERVFSIPAN